MPTYILLLVARMEQGILTSGIGAVAIAYLGDELPPARRGCAIGWYAMSLSWSALLGRVGGGVIAGAFGWRAMFIALGLLSLVGALTLTLGLPQASRSSSCFLRFLTKRAVGRQFALLQEGVWRAIS